MDVASVKTSTKSPARDAVFGTYELLESINLCLPLQDITQAATKVNKEWHEVVTRSVLISKHIMSDRRFFIALKNKHMKNSDILLYKFFWGSLIIKKDFDHDDIVYAIATSTAHGFEPRFLNSVATIPFLTAADREWFKHGWWMALKTWQSTTGGEAFLTRFELGLYKHLDPILGAKAEQLYPAANKKDGGRHRRKERLPRALTHMWSQRAFIGHFGRTLESEVDLVIRQKYR